MPRLRDLCIHGKDHIFKWVHNRYMNRSFDILDYAAMQSVWMCRKCVICNMAMYTGPLYTQQKWCLYLCAQSIYKQIIVNLLITLWCNHFECVGELVSWDVLHLQGLCIHSKDDIFKWVHNTYINKLLIKLW